MTKHYVAYFPNLDQTEWISTFRLQYDKKSLLVAPHITLVFPTDELSGEELRTEIASIVQSLHKFEVRFRCAIMMPESVGREIHSSIFLVPDEGFHRIVRLHDRLYSRKLSSSLRLDIPFVPHITIGSELELTAAKELVDQLNRQDFDFKFTVDQVSIVEIVEDSKDRVLHGSFALKEG